MLGILCNTNWTNTLQYQILCFSVITSEISVIEQAQLYEKTTTQCRLVVLTLCIWYLQEVIVRPGMHRGQRCQYFKVMDPSTPVCLASCGHFYEEDEYEMHMLEHGSAPVCGLQANS